MKGERCREQRQSARAWDSYQKVLALVEVARKKAVTVATETHRRATAAVDALYDMAAAPAWDAFDADDSPAAAPRFFKATAPLEKAFRQATEPAWRNYEAVVTSAAASYRRKKQDARARLCSMTAAKPDAACAAGTGE